MAGHPRCHDPSGRMREPAGQSATSCARCHGDRPAEDDDPPTAKAPATIEPTPSPQGQATAASLGLRPLPAFAAYQWIPLLGDEHPYPGAATPTSIKRVLMVEGSAWVRDDRPLVRMLERQGFAVQAGAGRFFHQAYESVWFDRRPMYLTTDAMYHTWHLVFDKVLRDPSRSHCCRS